MVLAAISLLTACPDYRHFEPYSGSPWAAEAVRWKFDHPWSPIPAAELAHRAGSLDGGIIEQLEKRSYRLSIPGVARLFGLNLTTTLMSQQVAGVMFLAVFLLLAREACVDAVSALLAGVMAATSFVGQWCFNDFTNFDCFSY
ncbi:MAG TPA: hypothetical protein VHI52_15435, partial [Verrucomicrobiae bacterium]|nr:hypothetical protein [Verrucomicrobiae bacterium]